jgi:aminoacrylate peracid reductase
MSWTSITPAGMPQPAAPYSLGAKSAEGWIFTAGLVAVDEAGQTLGRGDVRAQTQHVLDTAAKILAAAGGTLKDVIFVQIFLKDYSDYASMNEVYRASFQDSPFPPRYCIRADLVNPDWLVEIAITAKVA